MKGLIIKTTGSWYKILVPQEASLQEPFGKCYDGRLRGNYRIRGNRQTNPVAIGDWVLFSLESDGTAVISEVEDRRNYIVRRATKLSKQTHVIASNIDLLCVVATLGMPRTSTGFIDRLLVTAEAYHIPALLIFNKVDLYNEELWDIQKELSDIYTQAGYPVLHLSARTGFNIDLLRETIAGKVCLFTGHSGVGKSALLNALNPTLTLREGEVSDWSLKGKHTTTFAEIYPFALEGKETSYLMDTPGVKEFGMVDFAPAELSHFFPEMRSLLPQCHFANCTHVHEPHCAIKDAVEAGTLPAERYQNYLNILESIITGEVRD